MQVLVYQSEDNWFYSAGVTRDFGENKVITPFEGEVPVFASVSTLRVDPLEHPDLKEFGTINVVEGKED
jgi:hypothetical protein